MLEAVFLQQGGLFTFTIRGITRLEESWTASGTWFSLFRTRMKFQYFTAVCNTDTLFTII